MNAPPRRRCAPAALTSPATARSCSHDSTEHGPGHHADTPAADRDAVDADDGVGRAHLPARELERLEDRHHALHALQRLERLEPRLEPVVADRPDHGALLAAAHVRPEPERLDAPTDVLDLRVPDPWLQYDDHLDSLPAGADPARARKNKRGHGWRVRPPVAPGLSVRATAWGRRADGS